jgi:hypothetical protein
VKTIADVIASVRPPPQLAETRAALEAIRDEQQELARRRDAFVEAGANVTAFVPTYVPAERRIAARQGLREVEAAMADASRREAEVQARLDRLRHEYRCDLHLALEGRRNSAAAEAWQSFERLLSALTELDAIDEALRQAGWQTRPHISALYVERLLGALIRVAIGADDGINNSRAA